MDFYNDIDLRGNKLLNATIDGANPGDVLKIDSEGKITTGAAPSSAGIAEYNSRSLFPAEGEPGIIYIAKDTNKQYRWGITDYIELGLTLGNESTQAYPGNSGAQNAEDITEIQGLIPSTASSENKLATAADIPSVSGKADRVVSGTENNFAALDANGNLKDSGHKHSDYLTSHQDISGKADKVSGGTANNFAALDNNGNLKDSGYGVSNFAGATHTHTVSEVTDFPSLGTAAMLDVPESGDATSSEVVMGNDSRLTDARNAKDVQDWAKALNKPSYSASEVGAVPSAEKGVANGVATLDSTGKIPTSQIPSSGMITVDDTMSDSSTNPVQNKVIKSAIDAKQDVISDLETIRSGAALGATSIQSHQDISGKAEKSEMSITQGTGTDSDKVTIQLKSGVSAQVLQSHQSLAGKQDVIADLATIRSGAALGATAIQSHQDISGKANLTVIAPNFSSSASYAVGDYVNYNSLIYRCTTAHTGSWSNNDFTQVEIVTDLISQFDAAIGAIIRGTYTV